MSIQLVEYVPFATTISRIEVFWRAVSMLDTEVTRTDVPDVDVGVGAGLGVDAGVGVGLGVDAGVGVGLGVDAGVGVGLGVDAGVGVGAGVGLGVGAGMGGTDDPPYAAAPRTTSESMVTVGRPRVPATTIVSLRSLATA
jgi:hypothetical protein